MKNWMNKEGLKAIFKDAVALPYNLSKVMYNSLDGADVNKTERLTMAAGIHLPALMTGTAFSFTYGPAAGVAAFLAFSNAFAKIVSTGDDPDRRAALYPNTTAYADKIQQQKQQAVTAGGDEIIDLTAEAPSKVEVPTPKL